MNEKDYEFLINLTPRAGEPVHSDIWSQVYDYVHENYDMQGREYCSELIRTMVELWEQKYREN